MTTTDTPNLTKATIVEMLADRLNAQNQQIDKADRYWLVQVDEEMASPRILPFDDPAVLEAFLRDLVGKPGWVYVFQGYRCCMSIGSLPTLFTRDGPIPLFNVEEPLLSDDGAMTIPKPEEQIPETPFEDANASLDDMAAALTDDADELDDGEETLPFDGLTVTPPPEPPAPTPENDNPDVLG